MSIPAGEVSVERKLTAILCADVFGYSRLMGDDEEATHRTLVSHRKIIDSLIERHRGRFVNSAGDSVLAEFASVVNAVQCAVEVQNALKLENASLAADRRMEFRIGLNLGDVMVDGDQIYGDGVNVAARLESLADPGGICVSWTVHENVRNKLPLNFEDLGDQAVKNIAQPVRVFRILLDGDVPTRRMTQRVPRSYWRGGVFSLAGLAIIVVTIVLIQHVSLKTPHTNASIPPQETPALTLPDKPSIAVLPFINMGGDKEQEYFSDGITDDLITDLSRLPGLFVIARESTFTYKDKAAKLQDVGRELGVRYVLEGSVRKAAGQVRITVQLADATTGAELWAERYDRPLRDVFALQDEIVHRIITTLNLQLSLSQKGIVIPRTTDNLDAYDDVLRGTEYLASLTGEGNAKARPLFEKANELDPKYTDAYLMLGNDYFLGWAFAFNPDPYGGEKGLKMEQHAVALDDSRSMAHCVIAEIDMTNEQMDQAETEAQLAISLDPNSATAYGTLAGVFNSQVRPTEALIASSTALRLDPRNSQNYIGYQGWSYTELGRWKESIPALKASYPQSIFVRAFLANDYSSLGDDESAQAQAAEIERAVSLSPKSPLGYIPLAWAMNSLWKPAEALAAVDSSIRYDPRKCVCHLRFRGIAYAQLGQWQDSVTAFKPYLDRFHYDFWAHAYLAIDYIELGNNDAARAEVAEVRRLDPDFSVETIFPAASIEGSFTQMERLRGDLHKAGMS
jgi:adenylate cyclase